MSFSPASHSAQKIAGISERHGINANTVLTADVDPTVCQFAAAGLGVFLTHPLFVAGMEDLVLAHSLEPATPLDFLLCFGRDARDAPVVSEFVAETKAPATRLSAGWT